MFGEGLQFHHVIFFLVLIFVVVRFSYALKFKSNSKITTFEKSIWEFKFACIVFAAVILAAIFYLPTTGIRSNVNLEISSQESVVRQLAVNQQELSQQLQQLKEIGFYVLLVTIGFFWSTISFIGSMQNERRKGTFATELEREKVLGL